ncbi:MAG: phosphate acyltransferase PlsX [Anaerolineae bacterium]|nr:phosphate acyltransferase PlsX [Anaerolineae bacterium]
MTIRIALDVMGGDFAPVETIAGAVAAARQSPDLSVLLVGRPEVIQAELVRYATDGLALAIAPASEVIQFTERPALAVRQKPDASINVIHRLVRDGQADAALTLGHTGAALISAILTLGRLPGAERPAVILPSILGLNDATVMIDPGSNVDCQPEHLLQFAEMGVVYMRQVRGMAEPTVGLLSNGAEDNKGNAQTREALGLLRASGLRFVGNVEGHDLTYGTVNVVVVDGFAGNLVLKSLEGALERALALAAQELAALPAETQPDIQAALARLHARFDYATYGAVPILGVNGLSLIGHGRSRAPAVTNGLLNAAEAVEGGLVAALAEGLRNRQT